MVKITPTRTKLPYDLVRANVTDNFVVVAIVSPVDVFVEVLFLWPGTVAMSVIYIRHSVESDVGVLR